MTTPIVDRLRRLSFFSEDEYIRLNPDLASMGIDACEHAFAYAGPENRPMFKPHDLARAWGDALVSTKHDPETAPTGMDPDDVIRLRERHPKVTVFVSSSSGSEIKCIASCLADDLVGVGMRASVQDETSDPRQDHGIAVFVAPHDFFRLGLGPLWTRTKAVEQGFVYNSAPLNSQDFKSALPFILAARGIIDGSPQMAHLFRKASIPALHVQVMAPPAAMGLDRAEREHPLVMALPAASRTRPSAPLEWDARPVDALFFGQYSRRRSAFFGRNAARFSRYSTYVYHQQGGRDAIDEAIERRAHARIAVYLSGHAKVTLQIMEDEFHQFDWFGCVCRAMASGSLVVADFCPPHPLFKAGTHLFEDDIRHLPSVVDWLLRDEDGRRAALDARAEALAVIQSREVNLGRSHSLAAFLSSNAA